MSKSKSTSTRRRARQYEFASYPISRSADQPISRSGFAVRVRDDSMTPELPRGVVAFIDPEVKPKSGSLVLAFLDTHSLPTIAKYVAAGSRRYLEPSNSRFKKIRLTVASRIVGVVVETRTQLHPRDGGAA
jgi:SOS-response transcriptional repressor LexA